jgi:proline dehydrogenase
MRVTLDHLGENVATADEARAAVGSYQRILREMAGQRLEPNISIKLTMLGLDLGEALAVENVTEVLKIAAETGGFVRIDMEGSTYTEATVAVTERLHEQFPGTVGTVIQSYLHRSEGDVERLISKGIRVRLVKGAYAEPATVTFRDRRHVDESYLRLMRRLLDAGVYPAIATHDPALIEDAQAYVRTQGIGTDRFEFQMLYGVRRNAQIALTQAGYRMRVYVPYGTEWYPYFTRRIAERPANALFVLRQFFGG